MSFEIDLSGKTALITGASRGIGRATAVTMAKAGANVVVNYRSHGDEADAVAAEAREAGVKAMVYQADVSDREQVEAMFDAAEDALGHVSILVSNAYFSHRAPFLELEEEGVRRTMDVTYYGAFYTSQQAARRMAVRGEGGSICFVSSVLAEVPMPTSAPYNSAKAAINQMSATIANEMTPMKIRSNVIEPGWIDTPGERLYATEEEIREGGKKLPWGRLGTAEEIAGLATFLSSDAADYVTGSVFRMDGGFCLGKGPLQ